MQLDPPKTTRHSAWDEASGGWGWLRCGGLCSSEEAGVEGFTLGGDGRRHPREGDVEVPQSDVPSFQVLLQGGDCGLPGREGGGGYCWNSDSGASTSYIKSYVTVGT
jgi:hypothetical protein